MKLVERVLKKKLDQSKRDKECYYITSPYGDRVLNGKKSFHSGTDYGTHGKSWEQFAIEDGIVYKTGSTSTGGNYVEIKYDRLKRISRHIHLSKILVKKGDVVNNDTVIGLTGATGQVTGVHVHLTWKDYNGKTFDPELYNYEEPSKVRVFKKVKAISGLWLRKEPNLDNKYRVRVLLYGTKVEVLTEEITYSYGYYWDKVLYNGEVYYMASKHLKLVDTKKYIEINAKSGVWCRKTINGTTYKVIPNKTVCELIKKNIGSRVLGGVKYNFDEIIYNGEKVVLPNKWNKYI